MTRVLETDDLGALTIPADLLAEHGPHARYCVEVNGDRLLVQLEKPRRRATSEEIKAWRERWDKLAGKIGETSITDRSAVDILSEMRR